MLGFSRGSETGLELMPEPVTPTCTPPPIATSPLSRPIATPLGT